MKSIETKARAKASSKPSVRSRRAWAGLKGQKPSARINPSGQIEILLPSRSEETEVEGAR